MVMVTFQSNVSKNHLKLSSDILMGHHSKLKEISNVILHHIFA